MTTQRDDALRAELVRAATRSPYGDRMAPRSLVAGAAAIALAGALTGGAVSAVALTAAEPQAPVAITEDDVASVTARGLEIVGTHAELFGTPFIASGRGNLIVELGSVPEGASSIAMAIQCVEVGVITVEINGQEFGSTECSEEYGSSDLGGFASFNDQLAQGNNTIALSGGGNFVLWASWAKQAERPAQSQAQVDALVDGTVTAEEYDAGFDRFASCMAAAGHPLVFIDKSDVVYDYALTSESVSTGTDVQCYEAEFMEIDGSWQIANEDTSESTQILRDCLAHFGVEPAYPAEEVAQQMRDAAIDPRDCPGP
ncbi:hypothetical protein M2152_002139 [Microbacteriaceae bacterium SG_E_30_P1]|uniref:Uncharacterized protein n=1 Tax=Antiquaquibacter oligotrophicus TaxID=2880260 RepID=A0ABT6KPN1_9MICO|nr:hypothetical protein [Antiquaquibacter oligotrophicus]MDH6181957.1 hypothetical protein [Antiquaquibacter oligotrophicus]UDF12374.1 hypothetical protein LH407_09395 [Antiquaquibacter oligotrophicus]